MTNPPDPLGPEIPTSTERRSSKRVLNVGCGLVSAGALHPFFTADAWVEVRMDIDADVAPDIVGSVTDMAAAVPTGSLDAIWSSHSLEHLHSHEVPVALAEFRRVLKPDGFALITCPDLEAIAAMIMKKGCEHVAYVSQAGPITPLDMLYGHSASIARGKNYMAHNTGFTCASLGRLLVQANFPIVLAKREKLNVWALALMENTDKTALQHQLKTVGLDMYDDPEAE
jgi:SAM-dependent methyltransferase